MLNGTRSADITLQRNRAMPCCIGCAQIYFSNREKRHTHRKTNERNEQISLKRRRMNCNLRGLTKFGEIWEQEMRDPNATSLFFATPLVFNAPDRGVPVGRSP